MVTNYIVDPIYGCWLWHGRKDRDGYAVEWIKGKATRPHQTLWAATHGAVPDGLEIEHACRRRSCVRPAHKMLVTRGENLKLRKWSRRAKIKQCAEGHELAKSGLRTPEGGFVCRRCNRGKV